MPKKAISIPPEQASAVAEIIATFRHVATIPGGAMASWRVIIFTFLGIFGGGLGYTGWRFVTVEQAEKMIVQHEAKMSEAREEVKAEVGKNTTAVGGLTASIVIVQKNQNRDIAYRASKRVVDEQMQCRRSDNGCQDKQVDERERIRQLNMARLEKGESPCATLLCE